MSTRLNKELRETLAKEILRHKFLTSATSHVEARIEFSDLAYRETYPTSEREMFRDIPPGWLPQVPHFKLQFGASITLLEFNGKPHSEYYDKTARALWNIPTYIAASRTVPFKDVQGVTRVYDARHHLSLAHERIHRAQQALEAEYDEASKALTATLSGFNSVKALLAAWPEVATFASKYEGSTIGNRQLPVVQSAHLNALLDLPPETKENAPAMQIPLDDFIQLQ